MARSRNVTSGREAREQRKAHAKMRAASPHAQTPAQQLARLDQRLGKGVGAVKERARLAKRASRQELTELSVEAGLEN